MTDYDKTPDIPAALAAAQADLEHAQQRIAELQASLEKLKPSVRALEVAKRCGVFSMHIEGESRHLAIVNPRNCEALGVDSAELANAVRLAMCMRDFLRRWNITGTDKVDGLRVDLLGMWLVRELGLCNTPNPGRTLAEVKAAGWID